MQEGLDAFKSGQVAMMMNWFAFFPGLYKDPDVGGDKIGFFVNPKQNVEASHPGRPGHLGRQLLAEAGRGAPVHQVVRPARRAEEVVVAWAATPAHKAVLLDPGFPATAPFAADFLKAMSGVKDFWQEPAYASLDARRCRSACTTTWWPARAPRRRPLDAMVKDWTEVFEDEGKL